MGNRGTERLHYRSWEQNLAFMNKNHKTILPSAPLHFSSTFNFPCSFTLEGRLNGLEWKKRKKRSEPIEKAGNKGNADACPSIWLSHQRQDGALCMLADSNCKGLLGGSILAGQDGVSYFNQAMQQVKMVMTAYGISWMAGLAEYHLCIHVFPKVASTIMSKHPFNNSDS